MDDVVDVLCRVPYPRVADTSGDLRRKGLDDLAPVAQRLLEENEDPVDPHIKDWRVLTETYDSFANLIAAVNGVQAVRAVNKEGITENEFEKWAIKVCEGNTLSHHSNNRIES